MRTRSGLRAQAPGDLGLELELEQGFGADMAQGRSKPAKARSCLFAARTVCVVTGWNQRVISADAS